jgi:hypothetical protein
MQWLGSLICLAALPLCGTTDPDAPLLIQQ